MTKEQEEENKKLRVDNFNNLCKECSELTENAGITEEDTQKILKNYRDKIENSIPTSVIQNELDWYKGYEGTVLYEKYNYREIISVLQKILGKGGIINE